MFRGTLDTLPEADDTGDTDGVREPAVVRSPGSSDTREGEAMAVAGGGVPALSSQGYLEGRAFRETRALVSELCRVLEKRMIPGDMYVVPGCGSVRSTPSVKPYQHKPLECTNCAPLFGKKIEVMFIGFNVHYSEQVTSVKAVAQNGRPVIEPSRLCVVLDIEGTTTPISFVTDILFPYARDNVQRHLVSTYDSVETQDDIKLLRAQIKSDLEDGIPGSVPVPPDDAGKHEVIESLVANVEAMIKADRKINALKQLQGHIWRTGFETKELQGVVFDDVPEALEKWHVNGVKVYIYSSGSREAQRHIFGNTAHGDLRKYLCGFFDTTVGNKREARSYFEILQSVGVDKPSQILFVTDVYEEAVAAKAAGVEVVISVRPGNGPLPENHGFPTIRSFAEI